MSVEVRVAARGLARARGFTISAVTILGVAVAVNTAVFAFVRGTLIDRPAYHDPERIVFAWGSEPVNGQLRDVVSGSNFIDLRQRATSLESLAAVHGDDEVVMRDGRPEVRAALEVSVEFLRVFGVTPALGAGFDDADRREGRRASRDDLARVLARCLWR